MAHSTPSFFCSFVACNFHCALASRRRLRRSVHSHRFEIIFIFHFFSLVAIESHREETYFIHTFAHIVSSTPQTPPIVTNNFVATTTRLHIFSSKLEPEKTPEKIFANFIIFRIDESSDRECSISQEMVVYDTRNVMPCWCIINGPEFGDINDFRKQMKGVNCVPVFLVSSRSFMVVTTDFESISVSALQSLDDIAFHFCFQRFGFVFPLRICVCTLETVSVSLGKHFTPTTLSVRLFNV